MGFPTGSPRSCFSSLALVSAAPRHGVPLHHRRRLCSRIKSPRQSQDTFAIAGGDSSGSEPWLQCWCSEPPHQTCHCAFYSRKRDGRSAWCVLRLPHQTCVRSGCNPQGRGLLVLCCSIIPLKNELFCLPSPAPISFHHQSTLHTHPSMALPHQEGYLGQGTEALSPFSAHSPLTLFWVCEATVLECKCSILISGRTWVLLLRGGRLRYCALCSIPPSSSALGRLEG